jgi:hypothetical protein
MSTVGLIGVATQPSSEGIRSWRCAGEDLNLHGLCGHSPGVEAKPASARLAFSPGLPRLSLREEAMPSYRRKPRRGGTFVVSPPPLRSAPIIPLQVSSSRRYVRACPSWIEVRREEAGRSENYFPKAGWRASYAAEPKARRSRCVGIQGSIYRGRRSGLGTDPGF